MDIKQIEAKLKEYSQEHLINFFDELSLHEQEELLKQISTIDFDLISKIYNNKDKVKETGDVIEPIPYVDKLKLSPEDIQEYTSLGEEIIKNEQFAFVTLAGGQGTRLGHDGPKGTFKLDVNPEKTLFEIMCNNLKLAHEKYNVYIPWYIMTSRENNDSTIEFFEANNYLGYPKEKIMFFKQGELPMVDQNGKIMLETKAKIKEAADGHGGIFEAMYKNNVIQDMDNKNIKWIFMGGIDNVLLKMVDPLFIGMAEKKQVKLASKSIVKAYPEEKVGAFCKRNGKPSVVEYTEITQEMANMTDNNGELLYGEAHILCNLFSIDALKLIGDEKLPYHIAFKKSSYVDNDGNICAPDTPNAYKFETFIFDAFSKFEDMLILRTLREEEFAPIKNKEGVDSPETARELYLKYWSNK